MKGRLCSRVCLGTILTTTLLLSSCATEREFKIVQFEPREPIHTSIHPDKITTEPRRLAAEGVKALDEGELEGALKSFKQAVKLNMTDSTLNLLVGMAYHLMANQGDDSKFVLAEEGYKLAMKFDSSNWYAYFQSGLLAMDQRDFAKAQTRFSEALIYNVSDQDLLYSMLVASYFSGDIVTAAVMRDRLEKLEPDSPRFLKASVITSAALNKSGKAKASLAKFATVDAQGNQVSKLKRRIADWRAFHEKNIRLAQASGDSGMNVAPPDDSGMNAAPSTDSSGMNAAPATAGSVMNLAPAPDDSGMNAAPPASDSSGMNAAPAPDSSGMNATPATDSSAPSIDSTTPDASTPSASTVAPAPDSSGMNAAPAPDTQSATADGSDSSTVPAPDSSDSSSTQTSDSSDDAISDTSSSDTTAQTTDAPAPSTTTTDNSEPSWQETLGSSSSTDTSASSSDGSDSDSDQTSDSSGMGAASDTDSSADTSDSSDASSDSSSDNSDSSSDSSSDDSGSSDSAPKKVVIDENGMVIVDVVIIRTQENHTTSKGVNLLAGLTLQFGSADLGSAGFSFQRSTAHNPGGKASDTQTVTQAINIPSITYSLNIANVNDIHNEILARPSLTATNGAESHFFSGVHIQAATLPGEAGGTGDSVTFDDKVGVKLAVTPTLLDDGRIKLEVEAERKFLNTPSTSYTGFTSKLESSLTNVTATVVMNFGETLILSGLSEKETERNRDGVPGLQDVPGLQYFFSKKTTTDFTRSVLILLTPRLPDYTYREGNVKGPKAGQNPALDELRSRHMDWFKPYATPGSIFNHMQDNRLYREFRTGDVSLERWENYDGFDDRLKNALKFLYY